MEMRKCSCCKKELVIDNFSINPKSGELYKECNNCKERGKARYEANKENIAERYKAYYEVNKELITKRNKSYYEANKDKIAERYKVWSKANKDKIAERGKAYREANKELISERKKAYYEVNKDKIDERNKIYYKSNKEQRKAYREANKDKIAERSKAYREAKSLYDTYKDTFFGEFKEGENGVLLVKCKYCNKWFSPTNIEVRNYINRGNSLYCSDSCKKSCPTYGVHKHEKGFRQNTSREVQPELRKLVLERDNWTCQKCGANKDDDITVTLHCHHIDPVKNNPIESADMDNCVTLCKACHKEAHSRKGCRYSDLASCNTKD
jgi:5-methylcytosine-specific restriction endonuclease McrA